jgi:hypothetical protein
MPMNLRRLALAAAPVLCLGAAPPEDYDPMCRNGLFANEPPFALATINRLEERAVFQDDTGGCPWEGDKCAAGAYVVPGDTVIVSRVRNGFACAFYPSKGGGTAGWLATRQINLTPIDARTRPERWIGTWSSEGNPRLTFTERLGKLTVTGKAWWPGPPGTHDYPAVHEGEIDGPVEITGHTGHYGEDENLCEARFTLLGDYLLAGDNGNCGGANVTFSGVYRRVK